MEDSVGKTAVETIEVEAPVEVERDFDINELSSRDFFSLAAASLEVNVNKATPEAKVPAYEATESTIAELRAYYGDTILHYGKYSGTVEEVIDKCPAALFQVRRGFDSFVSWIDRHQVQGAVEDENEDEEGKELVSDDIVEPKAKDIEEKVVTKEAVQQPIQQTDKIIEKNDHNKLADTAGDDSAVQGQKAPANIHEEVSNEITIDAPETPVQKDSEPESKTEASSLVVLQEESEPEVEGSAFKSEVDYELEDTATDELVLDDTPLSKEADFSDELPQIEPTETQPDIIEVTADDGVDATLQSDRVEEVDENGVVDEVLEKTVLSTEDMEVSLDSEVPEIESSAIDMPIFERIEEALLEPDDEANESYDRVELNEVIERFEAWRDDAKAETPIDELFIKAVEDLDATFTEASIGADVTEEVLRSETEVSYEEFDLSSEDVIEQFDVSIEDEASPELYAMLLAVKSSRKTVEKLYTAKTKQECAEYINEIIIELSTVLRALGYDDPERIIRDFLSGHSPESLKNLIVELEKSLRHTVYRGVNARKAHGVSKRQGRVSKFINYIMQAVTSRYSVFES